MDLEKVREFERLLDEELSSQKFFRYEPSDSTINLVGSVLLSYTDPNLNPIVGTASRSLSVALPILAKLSEGSPVDRDYGKNFSDALTFMSHYYMIREYLYYTYNAKGSFNWEFGEDFVKISFSDRSILRQFHQGGNAAIVALIDALTDRLAIENEAIALLSGKEELGAEEHVIRGLELAEQEADLRIAAKFEMLGGAKSGVQFDGYRYADFYVVYRFLLAKFIYHRYYARANSVMPVFRFSKQDLVMEISLNTGLDESIVELVVKDMVYSGDSPKGMVPQYFELFSHGSLEEYLIIADSLIEEDGFAQLLRVQSIKSPAHFSRHISGPLGDGLVVRLAESFEKAGFIVRKNVSLSELGADLPDIDLLVISKEATLGYYVFACEVKATLPATWAKDYLRVLRKDSLPKAFLQVGRIIDALDSEAGVRFLAEKVISEDSSPMREGIIAFRSMIITSQNSGMFFDQPSNDVTVIDWKTLTSILGRCDGDVVYILHMLKCIREIFDVDPVGVEFLIGDVKVAYEVAAAIDPIVFPPNEWKSSGLDAEVSREFYEQGGSPFDVLIERGSVSRESETEE
ncbi:hypothetical protein EDD29_6971 [Actinocorallia herbida]|uniref:Restriction endonuclease n=1 Tax=Actinocorallia herbida TaxID=58109 RepID=A0A3N1D6X4_9ACTN|nr:hypothetical protein [Actinocorallia herbida]ROO89283.1 hypothetical protein EDD29_6971 [Actinocorallia herbida]